METSTSSLFSMRSLLSATDGGSSGDSSTSPASEDWLVPDYILEVDLDEELVPLDSDRDEWNCSLSGFVYVDADNNGQKGPFDAVFVGAKIIAYTKTDPGTQYSKTTDSNGMFYFDGLPPGTYALWQPKQPPDFVDGMDTVGRMLIPGSPIIDDPAVCGTALNGPNEETSNKIIGIQLAKDGYYGRDYNFGERGLVAGAVSKRLLLSDDPDPTEPVPEPSSLLLLICGGMCSLGATLGRRRCHAHEKRGHAGGE